MIVLFYAFDFFDNFTLAEKLFVKALRSFDTSVIINNNFCRKSFSSLESSAIFGKSFKASLVLFLIPDFNLLSCELGNFILSHFILTLH